MSIESKPTIIDLDEKDTGGILEVDVLSGVVPDTVGDKVGKTTNVALVEALEGAEDQLGGYALHTITQACITMAKWRIGES